MSQEEKVSSQAGEEKAPAKETKTSSRSRPVKVYLTVLFIVAILLLAMSAVMQQRSHQTLEDINATMSQSQSVMDLQMDKQRLEFELEQARKDRDDLEKQIQEKDRALEAMAWLGQIQDAYRTSFTQAKALVERFQETGLEKSLPDTSAVEGAPSPLDTYREIYATLF